MKHKYRKDRNQFAIDRTALCLKSRKVVIITVNLAVLRFTQKIYSFLLR